MNERLYAFRILYAFEKTHKRLDVLEREILPGQGISSNELRHIKNTTSGVLRHFMLLNWYIENLYSGKTSNLKLKLKVFLRLALYELSFMDHIPEHAAVSEYVGLVKKHLGQYNSKMCNALLRTYLRKKKEFNPDSIEDPVIRISTKFSFPKWMVQRWISYWGTEFTAQLCDAFNQFPEFDVRVNTQKASVDAFEKLLVENNISYRRSEHHDGFFKIKQISGLINTGLMDQGVCSVQDESAAVPVKLLDLKEGDSFLDVCAAPGGKFTQALERYPAIKLAIAVDSDFNRLKRVKENSLRLGLKGFTVQADASFLPFKKEFDKILIDAPCSGQGVIQKHPDIKWRRSEQEVNTFSELQKNILSAVSSLMHRQSKLVYSTCSIDKKENQDVVEAVLSQKNNLLSIPPSTILSLSEEGDFINGLNTFPHLNRMDGSFAAVLKLKK